MSRNYQKNMSRQRNVIEKNLEIDKQKYRVVTGTNGIQIIELLNRDFKIEIIS